MLVFPVRVQGQGAEVEIVRAIEALNRAEEMGLPRPDTIVVGRGGGSLEDLWNFNEEIVARAIFASEIPIISAVGHEIDFTIADFVADLRAPTPSAAAELLAPDVSELRRHFDAVTRTLKHRASSLIEHQGEIIELIARGALLREPQRHLQEAEQRLDDMEAALPEAITNRLRDWSDVLVEKQQSLGRFHPVKILADAGHRVELSAHRLRQSVMHRLDRLTDRIESRENGLRTLGPEGVLARGFSFTMNAAGAVVTDAEKLSTGDELITRLAKGSVRSRVE